MKNLGMNNEKLSFFSIIITFTCCIGALWERKDFTCAY